MNLEQKREYVRGFYKSWRHPVRGSQPEIPEYLSDDVVLEISGMPPFVEIEQAAASMDKFATEIPNLGGVTVDIKTIAANGDLVCNERVDYHCDEQGKAHIVVQICSEMESRTARSRGGRSTWTVVSTWSSCRGREASAIGLDEHAGSSAT